MFRPMLRPGRIFACLMPLCLVLSMCACSFAPRQHSVKRAEGFVPDAATAITIAKAVWMPIYGKEQIEGQKPFIAELRDGVWHVTGSLPEGHLGGTAIAEISKRDGRILRISHER